ncbi:hypothetical protein CPAR01_05251 [Colletotrichum paranaense]|uniref:Uncharacterized protein n=1 Tax=Colletotrichum paranaense TaxID=1914294 RepID=A0ABQ9SQQ9_9PEZI|nr:uncharacterized protein CPAR01_05251 [Colletotrichum paranaense]KAK1541864.1 hypothetical protein CPAR01_05251 [Colletotrichum paranaense]
MPPTLTIMQVRQIPRLPLSVPTHGSLPSYTNKPSLSCLDQSQFKLD